MKRRWSVLVLSFVLGVLLLSGCGSESSSSSNYEYVIGVTQIVEHPSLDEAFTGFKKALEENGLVEGEDVKYDLQIAQGEISNSDTIAKNFVGDQVDLIFANSTPSAISALNATKDIPIIFTSVTDPVGAELVEAFDKPGENITGTSDTHPLAMSNTIEFMLEEIGVKKVGVVYNAGEQNSKVQVEQVQEMLEKEGASLVEVSVSNSSEVKQAAESLVGRIDSIFFPTDNTVVQALESLIDVANQNDLPLFASELDSMEKGAFAATGFSYKDLGYQTGLMAVEILEGNKKPSEMDVEPPNVDVKLTINKKAAEEQGITIKEEWNEKADYYEGE
ncbi:ABC transporter substrate-binding protein [Bacillus carboniphilus]|uniref:ABC transporter substrate-binding protein n=1 Tax=Bacillus carboniphilus TaxID=86663 RepID=A0ABY9JX46_9BACI|nr:ABC transporter substrate-binding protein [Bacillus carboniphilus]WLR43078.1 ABC transporter substrate-binding protein [Bacillus carboniphilus]